jgi:hypothetical protein
VHLYQNIASLITPLSSTPLFFFTFYLFLFNTSRYLKAKWDYTNIVMPICSFKCSDQASWLMQWPVFAFYLLRITAQTATTQRVFMVILQRKWRCSVSHQAKTASFKFLNIFLGSFENLWQLDSCLSVRMEQLGCDCMDFHFLWKLGVLRKSVEKIKFH